MWPRCGRFPSMVWLTLESLPCEADGKKASSMAIHLGYVSPIETIDSGFLVSRGVVEKSSTLLAVSADDACELA